MEVKLVRVLGHHTKQLRGMSIHMEKVLRDDRTKEVTWELEEDTRRTYPHLFTSMYIFLERKFYLLRDVRSYKIVSN